nr:hypothetical protein [Chthoniobacter flavus]
MHRKNLQAGIVQEIERTPQVAVGKKIAEDHGDATPAMMTQKCFDSPLQRRLATAFDVFQKREELPLRGASARRDEPRGWAFRAHRIGADFFATTDTEHTQRGGQSLRERELFFEEHRARGVDEQGDVQFLFLVELLEVGPLDAGENIPVHETHIVARRVVAIVAELRARAALHAEMLAAPAIGEASRDLEPQPRQPVEIAVGEQRGQLRRGTRHAAASSGTALPASMTSAGTLKFSARPS